MSFPKYLTEIDELTRSDHTFLEESDSCYYLGEYTARKGFAFSATNHLIYNLKKPVNRRGRAAEWQYKEHAIIEAGSALKKALDARCIRTATFVPIPPSKSKSDPLYDDRMTRVIQAIRPNAEIDIRELIVQERTVKAYHSNESSRNPDRIRSLYSIDEELCEPEPSQIIICDDVLTTGAHFKAAQSMLSERFPGVRIDGLFIARRIPEAEDVQYPNIDF